ncbi:MAG: SDR family oxidoreductase [Rhizobiaceae bacterium]|nr:SDR family oxidoreductase [Rhizobiaceae bacterium]
MRLEGKKAFITAAGQGIGKATVEAFIREGAKVLATDINGEALATLEGCETLVMDAMDPAASKSAIGDFAPDILFNCAGFVHNGTILEASEEELDFAFNLNVKAQFHTIRAALPGMIERGGGVIVNMSSVCSSVISAPSRMVYGTTKAAVIGLTKSVAKDYVTDNIRCNCICPGTVESPSLHERLHATGDFDKAMADFVARQPMGRIATAEEIANLVVYLASDESSFTTGQAHIIDGGWAN